MLLESYRYGCVKRARLWTRWSLLRVWPAWHWGTLGWIELSLLPHTALRIVCQTWLERRWCFTSHADETCIIFCLSVVWANSPPLLNQSFSPRPPQFISPTTRHVGFWRRRLWVPSLHGGARYCWSQFSTLHLWIPSMWTLNLVCLQGNNYWSLSTRFADSVGTTLKKILTDDVQHGKAHSINDTVWISRWLNAQQSSWILWPNGGVRAY